MSSFGIILEWGLAFSLILNLLMLVKSHVGCLSFITVLFMLEPLTTFLKYSGMVPTRWKGLLPLYLSSSNFGKPWYFLPIPMFLGFYIKYVKLVFVLTLLLCQECYNSLVSIPFFSHLKCLDCRREAVRSI